MTIIVNRLSKMLVGGASSRPVMQSAVTAQWAFDQR